MGDFIYLRNVKRYGGGFVFAVFVDEVDEVLLSSAGDDDRASFLYETGC